MSYLARARNAAILLALAAAAPLSAQTAPLKIAYVNTRNILDAAPGRPDAGCRPGAACFPGPARGGTR